MNTTTTLRTGPAPPAPAAGPATTRPRARSLDVTVRTDDRILLSVDDAAERLDIGRTFLYKLIAGGQIHTIRVGRLRKVPVEALREYIERLRALAQNDPTTQATAR